MDDKMLESDRSLNFYVSIIAGNLPKTKQDSHV